jgi:hypothetical protein
VMVLVLGHTFGKRLKVKRESAPGILLTNKEQIQ